MASAGLPEPKRITRARWLALMRSNWHQGEHIAVLGPTGSGKTWVARELVMLRRYVVVLAVKREDATLKQYKGFHITRRWPDLYGNERVIFWPKMETLADLDKQRGAIATMLDNVYLAGGWCVDLDDMSYLCEHLGLRTPLVTLLNQGRSSGISAVPICTRPRRVPLEAFNQCTRVMIFRLHDDEEVRRAAQIAGIGYDALLGWLRGLEKYEFLSIGPEGIYHVTAS